MYFINKVAAYFIGALIYSLPAPINKVLIGGSNGYIRGCTAPNKAGDFNQFYDFNARFMRINGDDLPAIKNFAEMAGMWGYRYFILTGQAHSSDDENAKQIATIDNMLVGNQKPEFYALVNEVNEEDKYSNDRVENTRNLLKANYGKTLLVTRGAHTGINESGAIKAYFEYFSGKRKLLKDSPHLIHFYLKPGKGFFVWFDNLLRKSMLTYMLFKLNKNGIPTKHVIIDESHDADKHKKMIIEESERQTYTVNENGTQDGDLILEKLPDNKYKVIRYSGDFVFATKEGWTELENLAKKLGIPVMMYYAAPFLYYKGNTMLVDETNGVIK